jgi:hypothetical protein
MAAFASSRSFAVRAVAGAGKTSTLRMAWTAAPREGLAVAFGARNAADLKAALPSAAEARTMNSLGHAAWGRHLSGRLSLDADKMKRIANDLSIPREDFRDFLSLIGLAKSYGYAPQGVPGAPKRFLTSLDDLCDEHDLPAALIPLADRALDLSIRDAWRGKIDFNDQLYMPALYNSIFPTYPLVAVDEAQDLSAVQHWMVARCLAPGGQLIVIGDPSQAIYAWRGAESNSFSDLVSAHNLPTLPLHQSFRCPQAVVREAQRYVPEMEAWDRAPVGTVTANAPIAVGHAVIARTNAALFRVAFSLLRRGILPNYLGRDFLTGLRRTLAQVRDEAGLESWWASVRDDKRKLARNTDRYLSLRVLFDLARKDGRRPDEVLAKLLGNPSDSTVTLSTIHKAKGLEWPFVHLDLNSHFTGNQEANVAYVGITRAQATLSYIKETKP